MQTIWNFQLTMTGEQEIFMPAGAKALCVRMQGNLPQLWALIDESCFAAKAKRKVLVAGIGHLFEIDSSAYDYVGMIEHYASVWHVFVSKEK